PTELHAVDGMSVDGAGVDADEADTCAHHGGGEVCGHDCADCVLASLRPSPNRTRADRLSS
ncbi:hypothetical protein, partial [Jatrophihabitans endophyticus]|uniref:hypothetical protein n=1 Tax=Jatrophihabitans endophyticus TaxID=1206085 RepID=UPI0026E9D516